MSKIFLSHSSVNNAHALALAQWLKDRGWDDYFLDIAPAEGLRPGERWQEALRKAAHRCEAVVVLLSPAWCDSRWCQAEFLVAKQLNKNVFGVIVEPTSLERLPPELTTEHQLCDFTRGSSWREFAVALDPVVPPTRIQFAQEALTRLRLGLEKSGLSPLTFPWPPPGDPERLPYRGLRALDIEDAAVFFGREAPIVHGLDMLRGMRERRIEQAMVILGASGAGKSSLLRAGLWPRMHRDDRHFLPLPIVRPERAAISGDFGLAASLAASFKSFSVPRSRGQIREQLGAIEGLRAVLRELNELACSTLGTAGAAPSIVLPIDQAEELFSAEGGAEAAVFLDLLGLLLGEPIGSDALPPILAIMTIRSDAYERLQSAQSLQQVRIAPFDLRPIGRTEFRAVIEGPATRASDAGQTLNVDPKLTEALLHEAEGADALPLLAFIMERLFVEYGADGDLTLAEYEKLGGIRGAIEQAVQNALKNPQSAPAIPVDENAQLRCLKAGFVPWLAAVDVSTNERRRRVARWADIPEEARPFLERLVHVRLLTRDQRVCPGGEVPEPVVEIAHESLLRQWPALRQWLETESRYLVTAAAIEAAAQEWDRQNRSEDFLVHARGRLESAEALMRLTEYSQRVGRQGLAYLAACRAKEDAAKNEREAQVARTEQEQKRVAREQARRARAQRFATAALVSVLVIVIVASALLQRQKNLTARQSALVMISAARNASYPEQALRLATVGMQIAHTGELADLADAQLRSSAFASNLKVLLNHGPEVHSAAISPSGDRVMTASEERLTIWNAANGETVTSLTRHEAVNASFTRSGRYALTGTKTSDGNEISEVLDLSSAEVIGWLPGHDAVAASDESYVVSVTEDGDLHLLQLQPLPGQARTLQLPTGYDVAALSPSGAFAILAGPRDARVWDIRKQSMLATLENSQHACHFVVAPDDAAVAGWCSDRIAVWTMATGRRASYLAIPDQENPELEFVTFDVKSQRLVATDGANSVVRAWNVSTGGLISTMGKEDGASSEVTPALSPAGDRLALVADDGTVRVWDVATGKVVVSLNGHTDDVSAIAFSADGRAVLTASVDGTARLWNVAPRELAVPLAGLGNELHIGKLSRHGERVIAGSRAPARVGVWDTATGRLVLSLPPETIAAAISGDGRRALTIDGSGARAWDVNSGRPIRVANVVALAGALLDTSGSHAILWGEQSWRLWNIDDDDGVAQERRLIDSMPVLFSPDSRHLLLSSDDRPAELRYLDGRRHSEIRGYPDRTIGVAFDAAGSNLIAVSNDGSAITWSLIDGATKQSAIKAGLSERSTVTFSGDLSLALTGRNGALEILDVKHGMSIGRVPLIAERSDVVRKGGFSGMIARVLGLARPVHEAVFSADGRRVVALDRDGLIHVIDLGILAEPDAAVTLRTICDQHLMGFNKITAADIEIAPVLEHREGQDVCGDGFKL